MKVKGIVIRIYHQNHPMESLRTMKGKEYERRGSEKGSCMAKVV
jgi:hypothetical protein